MTRKGQTDVMLLDFAKAFDKVPHHRLRLWCFAGSNHFGVKESNQPWYTEADVLSGVQQGTALSWPLESTKHSDARLFADD